LGKQYLEFGEGKFLKFKRFHLAYLGKLYLAFGEGKFLKFKKFHLSYLGAQKFSKIMIF